MSTFFGGPQLASVTSVQGNINTTSSLQQVVYTVPAGFNANIKGVYNPFSLIGTTYYLRINGIDVSLTDAPNGQLPDDKEKYLDLFLPSGSVVAFIAYGLAACRVSFCFGIQLYKNP